MTDLTVDGAGLVIGAGITSSARNASVTMGPGPASRPVAVQV